MLGGCITALVTPMRGGIVDLESFGRLLEFQRKNGVGLVVTSGSTGESPTLSDGEKASLITTALHAGAEVIAGCGSNDTAHSMHLCKDAFDAGCRRALLVDCYYNTPSSMELRREYYSPICQALPEMKFTAYPVPSRTSCEMSPEDLALAHQEYANLDSLKDATGNIERMRLARKLAPRLTILSGDDAITMQMMQDPLVAASGVISVASNLVPHAIVDYCNAICHNPAKALELTRKLTPLFNVISIKSGPNKFRNPLPYKAMMAALGMIEYGCRRPLGKMDAAAVGVARDALRSVWSDSPELLDPVAEFYGVDIGDRIDTPSNWEHY